MGLQSVINGIVSLMIRDNSTSSRTITAWGRRTAKIARDLEQPVNSERQAEFQATVVSFAERQHAIATQQLDDIPNRIEPGRQSLELELVLEADKALDAYQAPPTGHSETMKRAKDMDKKELAINIEGLKHGSNGLLVGLSRPADAAVDASTTIADMRDTSTIHSQKDDLFHVQRSQLGFTGVTEAVTETGIPSTSYSQASFKSYTEVVKRMHSIHDRVNLEPSIIFYLSEMTLDGAETLQEFNVSYDHNFADLSSIMLDGDLTRPIPHFWLRKRSNQRVRETVSPIYWECQMSRTNISEAIQDQQRDRVSRGGVGMKSVIPTGREYVVILVKKDAREYEMPIDIPIMPRKPALDHFQETVFPQDSVIGVLNLENGDDASRVIFDGNSYNHKTNPLLLEVSTGRSGVSKGKYKASAL